MVINLAANPKTNQPSTSVHRFCRGSAMDAGRLEQQVASVERGITFLKQEHLAMLTGLQLEITHLKRRCHGQCTGELLLPFHYVLTCLIFVCLPACCTTSFLACRAELWAGLQVSRQKHSRWEITNPCWAREKWYMRDAETLYHSCRDLKKKRWAEDNWELTGLHWQGKLANIYKIYIYCKLSQSRATSR